MTIVLVGPVPPPTGGVAAHIAAVARGLGAIGVHTTTVDPRERLRLVSTLGLAGMARDIVHVHVSGHGPKPYGLVAAALATTPLRPAMVTLHSGLIRGFFDGLGASGRRTIAGLLERASAVVAVSDAIADAVAGLGMARPHVVSPFVARALRPGRPPAHAAAAAGSPLIAAAVGPGAIYGAAVLARGFARLSGRHPDAVLAVFGPGAADREVGHRLADLGVTDNVLLLGELDPATALGVVAVCDVFVRPTLADGDAMSVREARALGRRTVASDVARRPAGTALFRAGDADALSAAIEAALTAPPPPPAVDDGFADLLAIYARLGATEVTACAASQAA
jgi:glycosyltransferase involved in cell wall biosynthesis